MDDARKIRRITTRDGEKKHADSETAVGYAETLNRWIGYMRELALHPDDKLFGPKAVVWGWRFGNLSRRFEETFSWSTHAEAYTEKFDAVYWAAHNLVGDTDISKLPLEAAIPE